MKITTVKSGYDYRVTDRHGNKFRLMLDSDSGVVAVYTRDACLGGYSISRFDDGELSPQSIKRFFLGHSDSEREMAAPIYMIGDHEVEEES